MVVRIVPVEGVAVELRRGVTQQPDEAPAVHRSVVPGVARRAGDLQEGRIQVIADDRLAADAAGFGHARPADEPGDPDPTLVGRALAGAEADVDRRAGEQAAVVRGEDHHRPVGDPQRVELVEELADAQVEALDHRRVGGVEVLHAGLDLRLVLGDQVGLGLQGRVDRVLRVVEEEGAVAVGLDEPAALVRQAVGQVLAGGSVGERGDVVGGEIARRRTLVVAGDVDVETVSRGVVVGAVPQVPFADARRDVPRRLQRRGDRHLVVRQVLGPVGDLEPGLGPGVAGNPVGDVRPRGILAGHDRRAGRRADGAGRIAVGEPHRRRGQAIDVRRLVEVAAGVAEVGPAHVIDQDQHDVRRPVPGRGALRDRRHRQACPDQDHRGRRTADPVTPRPHRPHRADPLADPGPREARRRGRPGG